jgi:hypothetical protein
VSGAPRTKLKNEKSKSEISSVMVLRIVFVILEMRCHIKVQSDLSKPVQSYSLHLLDR